MFILSKFEKYRKYGWDIGGKSHGIYLQVLQQVTRPFSIPNIKVARKHYTSQLYFRIHISVSTNSNACQDQRVIIGSTIFGLRAENLFSE